MIRMDGASTAVVEAGCRPPFLNGMPLKSRRGRVEFHPVSGLPRGRSDGRVSDMERESGERVWRSRSSMVQVPAPVRSSPALIDPAYERRFDFVQFRKSVVVGKGV